MASERGDARARRGADRAAAHRHLVAARPPPAALFAQVTEEVGRLLARPSASIVRYEDDASATVVGSWTDGGPAASRVGASLALDGDTVIVRVLRTGAPQRVETTRASAARSRSACARSASARPWPHRCASRAGCGAPSSRPPRREHLPEGAERRLCDVAELVAQALANADAHEILAASRARIVEAGDAERRRLERNLHDGAQQRLVSLALQLRLIEASSRATRPRAQAGRRRARELREALEELRELARGIHPAVLTDRGLARPSPRSPHRSPVPVEIADVPAERLPAPVEAAAYYIIAEAITNVAKHATRPTSPCASAATTPACGRGRPTTASAPPTPRGLGAAGDRRPCRGAPRAPARRQPARPRHPPRGAHSGRPVMTAARMWAVVLAAIACGAGVVAVLLGSDRPDAKTAWAIFGPAVGWSFIGVGLYAPGAGGRRAGPAS